MIIHKIVAQGCVSDQSMAAALNHAVQQNRYDRLDVAVAYATTAGIAALRNAIGEFPQETRWVVGLDDAITQPAAIDELISLRGSTLLLASLSGEGRRFHPKVYCFWSAEDPSRCMLALGSANMTLNGLNSNGEVGVLLLSESAKEAVQLKETWEQMASLGKAHGEWDLEEYRQLHSRARRVRTRMSKAGLPIDPEFLEESGEMLPFNGEPPFTSVAWTEGASPSAGGRDLEFPRKMMPFFGLTKSPSSKRFRMADGSVHQLTFTMRTDNQMWRLLFTSDAIRAGIGRENMRPLTGGNRSDLAIVFERRNSGPDYDVKFVVIGSAEHSVLINKSKAVGALERTRDPGGRYFGYF